MKIEVSKEDYDFLKELQHELNTQDTDCQADPVYWSVMESREVLTLQYDGDARIPFDDGAYSVDELVEEINEEIIEYDQDIRDEWHEVDKNDAQEVADFAVDRLGWDNIYNDGIYYVTEEDCISQFSGAFLTKRACQEHIDSNRHHYNEPHTYANTAYRNYELERLLKVLKTMKIGV